MCKKSMETTDIVLASIIELPYASYTIADHPLLAFIAFSLLFYSVVTIYCRLTVGMCDSDEDMTGKTVLITGGTSGIGKATAMDLAKRNARVILACRNMEKADQVAKEIIASTGNKSVVVKHMDLASFETVRKCAEDVLRTEEKLHVIINNAGVYDEKEGKTEDGCEYVLQSNHFGHFLLTMLLLDLLKKSAPSRIINVSSACYIFGKLDMQDLAGEHRKGRLNMYGRSKLANILFTRELASRLENTGVTVNAAHPGVVDTGFVRIYDSLLLFIWKIILKTMGKTSREGAQTTIHLAVHPGLEKTSGKFFMDCREKFLFSRAKDKILAKKLFEISEKIVGIEPMKA